MEELVYKSINSYFLYLSRIGYLKLTDVHKILTLAFIYDMVYQDFTECVSTEDILKINDVLYKLFGKICFIPYHNFCLGNSTTNLYKL